MFKPIRETVRRIPRGKVATYGQVAKAAGFPVLGQFEFYRA